MASLLDQTETENNPNLKNSWEGKLTLVFSFRKCLTQIVNFLEKIKNICKKKGLSVNDTNKKKLDLKHVEDVYDECLKWLNN